MDTERLQNMLENPHVIAALACHAIGRKVSKHARIDSTKDRSFTPAHSIHNEKTNLRSFPILDALASISVSQPRGQVVAVSLQINHADKQIRLTIAENYAVEDSTVQHITEVWDLVRELSDQFAEVRRNAPDGGKWTTWREESPDMPAAMGATESTKVRMISRIYQFTMNKNMKRINKWWAKLFEFMKFFKADKKKRRLNMEGLDLAFMDVGVFLKLVIGKLRIEFRKPGSLTSKDWADLAFRMDYAAVRAKLLLENLTQLESYASSRKSKDEDWEWFDLRRAIEKLISQHGHITSLIAFAHSPRLRESFKFQLLVEKVPPQPVSAPDFFPRTESEWELVVQCVCNGIASAGADWKKEQGVGLQKRFTRMPNMLVHCECSLIAFLETSRGDCWDEIPAFGFIGVSKLSCNPCFHWINQFNELTARKYYTKGTHGKWYQGWTMPRIPGTPESLGWNLANALTTDYITYVPMVSNPHSKSDSTNGSFTGARFNAETEETQQRVAVDRSNGFEDFETELEE